MLRFSLLLLCLCYFAGGDVCSAQSVSQPDLGLLTNRLGTWDEVMTVVTATHPNGVKLSSLQSGSLQLRGRFIEVTNQGRAFDSRMLATFDPRSGRYDHWFFSSNRQADHWIGTASEDGKEIRWTMKDANGGTAESKWIFLDANSIELTANLFDADGKLVTKVRRSLTRKNDE
ncbi:DUF1579 family protein [Planctomycetes bacterium TBK1r]|uniref:DUF1579 domain-containing protein n=1 Tax=Stieleria magnilauensis TaxID=2527963 RepID=A0ABX5XRC8_9BACT|nr:hypothetical protein TBK1r_21260 [Planctomycetes bacterium TBK1r]